MRSSTCRFLVALFATCPGALGCAGELDVPADAEGLRRDLHAVVAERVQDGRLARQDGYVYAVDIGQLCLYAARVGDRELYETLRDDAREHLIVDVADDPYTQGFVLWRHSPDGDAPPDASGTTEALRIAEALWTGASRFDAPADRDTALRILAGYARHATVDQGVWMLRNYFKFETRSFATNSFLVDYAPDFVDDVAVATGNEGLAEIAGESYALVERAVSRSGLPYDIIQPELATLMNPSLVVFSPNDEIQLPNAATVALQVARGRPALARRVLEFARERMPAVGLSYTGRTGQLVDSTPPGAATWAALTRIALALGDARAFDLFYPRLRGTARALTDTPSEPFLYAASEALLALAACAESEAETRPRPSPSRR